MKREIKTTFDNSKTLYIEEWDESYHSQHGALQEAQHVFIKNGFRRMSNRNVTILELGFGTGLNTLVTINELLNKKKSGRIINYFAIEKHPIDLFEVEQLDYYNFFDNKEELKEIYTQMHSCNWNQLNSITPNFKLCKYNADFFNISELEIPPVDLVYFDCFSAKVQPNLWEKPLFEIVVNTMNTRGLLTTYSSKGSVKRILKELGCRVEKLEGPEGKREMINAWKL